MNETQADEVSRDETPRAAEMPHEVSGVGYRRSATLGKLTAALAKAMGKIGPATKDAENPHYKSSYATLASCHAACIHPLTENELTFTMHPHTSSSAVQVTGRLHHSSDEWIESTITMPVAKPDAHGVASAISYGKRYLYCMVGVVADDDDDGNAATGKPSPAQPERQAPRREPPAPHPTTAFAATPNPDKKPASAPPKAEPITPAPTKTVLDPGTGEPMSDELGAQITAAFRALGYGKGPEPAAICKQVTGKSPRNAQGGSNLDQADGLRLLAYLRDEAAKKGIAL